MTVDEVYSQDYQLRALLERTQSHKYVVRPARIGPPQLIFDLDHGREQETETARWRIRG